ncbi:MAG: PAS domain S-box protein [Desulfobacteraceae bacterium]|nr:MAG: PAS domain S-box protein [Desulfobacteraceae bacterium]
MAGKKQTTKTSTISSADTAYRSVERRYRALLEFLPDPVFVVDVRGRISYLNPAFMKTFGWNLEELEGKHIPFVPAHLKEETRQGIRRLQIEKVIHGFETKRLTKDGKIIDVVLDGAIYFDEDKNLAGQVIILRDVTRGKRVTRMNEALYRVAKALPQYQSLNDRLEFIIKEVQEIIGLRGASVILIDERKNEFFFRQAVYEDGETDKRIKEIRFPADKGVAGYVYRTGKPLIVPDYPNSPYFFGEVDEKSGYQTKNMIDVPIRTPDRIIGVLCAVNKKEGEFDEDDLELLSAIASTVASPIENARINEELKRSYEEVKSLNKAKDRVIHHLSHELKTPVSVLSASLSLLTKKLSGMDGKDWKTIMDRAERNLKRILEMQYEVEDILKKKDYTTYYLISALLDACSDEMEVLASLEAGEENMLQSIRKRIEDLFGPRESVSEKISLDVFTKNTVQALRPLFAHRMCHVEVRTEKTPPICIPRDVLTKIIEGLVRNAVCNTPDGGEIVISVKNGETGPALEVRDFGVGITEENRRLIFESYITTRETMQYSTRKPYDFNAGGKGFDLLRMKIFSERYNFKIGMTSTRCSFIPDDDDLCPGDIKNCSHCTSERVCHNSGGTAVVIIFPEADAFMNGGKSGRK